MHISISGYVPDEDRAGIIQEEQNPTRRAVCLSIKFEENLSFFME